MKRKQRGFGIFEVVTTTGIVALVAVGSGGLLVSMFKSFQYSGTQFSADMQTSQSIQKLAKDLQEAKQITLISSTDMRIYYPQKDANGVYTSSLDNSNTVDYYLGDFAGNLSSAGTYLIRKPNGGSPRRICDGVILLDFTSPDPDSVDVSLKAKVKVGSVTKQCDMVHRAIFLRNY